MNIVEEFLNMRKTKLTYNTAIHVRTKEDYEYVLQKFKEMGVVIDNINYERYKSNTCLRIIYFDPGENMGNYSSLEFYEEHGYIIKYSNEVLWEIEEDVVEWK